MSEEPTQLTPGPRGEPGDGGVPRVLGGRYEIGELIGRGGMADVHAGHDLRLGRTVAIKILRTDLARDTSFLSRFRREAQAAAGLNHPAIVGVFDSGEEEVREPGSVAPVAVPYIVMEHVQGRTLRELLNDEGTLPADEAARIVASVLSALEYAHDRGLVHRDIKPANVMVTAAGAVKVMDFGIARALADTAATMTQTQAVMGTARYLSPEQAQGLDVDGRSDLYSTGCLLYELVAGRTPFQGDPVSLVYQHLGETPSAPSTHVAGLPQELDAITLHALEKSPDDRYQTAADFRADLNAARAGEPVSEAAEASYRSALGPVPGGAGAAAIARSTGTDPGATGLTSRVREPRPLAEELLDDPTAYPEDRWERTDEIPVRERRHRGAGLLLGVLALLAAAGVAWALWMAFGDRGEEAPVMVVVPDVRGLMEADARLRLTEDGFTVPRSSPVADDAEQGTVIEQNPLGGTAVEGSEVRITVSGGPSARAIPEVDGMEDADAARRLLEQEGFTGVVAEAERRDDPERAKGEVIGTDPPAGDEVPLDRAITIIVASGKTEVPRVVELDMVEAYSQLKDLNLKVTIERVENGTVDEGVVLAQSVEEGKRVDYGTTVVLTVATTPPRTETSVVVETVTQAPPPTTPSAPPTSEPPTDPGPTTEPTEPPAPTTDPPDPPDPPEDTDEPPPTGPGNNRGNG